MEVSATPILETKVESLHGIGPARALLFAALELRTVGDLLRHLPFRHEFEHAEEEVAAAALLVPPEGANLAVRGEIVAVRVTPGRKPRIEATLSDGSGTVRLVFFNAPWMKSKFHPGLRGIAEGKAKSRSGYIEMSNPKWTSLASGTAENAATEPASREARLRPVYAASESVSSALIEQTLAPLLLPACAAIQDPLPAAYRELHALPILGDAYRAFHAPRDLDELAAARRRLAYDELLTLQLAVAIRRRLREDGGASVLATSPRLEREIFARFPFKLTAEQVRAFHEIATDLGHSTPMNRLLQGDVGAGKTAVALSAMLLAKSSGAQSAIMAPTELLAEQHLRSISKFLEGSNVRVALLTGSLSASQRAALRVKAKSGEIDMLIGTHALLTDALEFQHLALAVIDEQHRFGVSQRAVLRSKSGVDRTPHMLVMTATPIPRTLALTVYGDLDVSVIRAKPMDRQKIHTRLLPSARADEAYQFLRTRIEQGEQAFIVVPAVENSDLGLKAVATHLTFLQQGALHGLRLASMHGQMKSEERDATMTRFLNHELDALVATVVIEVGVDVPNATVMVVEHAERFGLAQLHQLRGRVGRGTKGGVAILIGDATTDDGHARLEAIRSTDDGFKIAELDLAIRGPGEFFGARQSGLPPFVVADLTRDLPLLELARRDAVAWIARSPRLAAPEEVLLRRKILHLYGEAFGLGDVA